MKSKLLDPTILTFVAIVVLVTAWIASGMLGHSDIAVAADQERAIPSVSASWSKAARVDRTLSLYGEVEPTKIVMLRARADGIIERAVSQGTVVTPGQDLAQLSTDDRRARLSRANAQLAVARRNHDAAERLAERGIGTEADVQTRLAELEAARADLDAIELEIENTTLRSPISGTINRVVSDVGSFVSLGGEVFEIVDNDPLVAVIHVQQSQITRVEAGMPASVGFIGGEETEGRVTFISPLADAATRTFRVEVEVPNPEGRIPAGLSVEVTLTTQTVEAHHISSALLRLDEYGRLGLYVVGADDEVKFRSVEIVMANSSGIWVGGLDARERLVTISQGGIGAGETVDVHETPEDYRRRVIAPLQDARAETALSGQADVEQASELR